MEHTTTQHKKRGPFRRFVLAPFSIIATVLYVFFFGGEVLESLHHPHPSKPESESRPPLIERLHSNVEHQLEEIRRIDAAQLGGTFIGDLDSQDCTWYFQCSSRDLDYQQAVAQFRACPMCPKAREKYEAARALPKLIIPFGPIPIPTFHLIFGLPHALAIASQAIGRAGFWAVTMFLTCAVIYVALCRLLLAKDQSNLLVIWMMIVSSPLAIILLVQVIQALAAFVFRSISWALGELVIIFAYSSALSLVVAIPHVWKAPREVIEAAEVIRNV